RQGRGAAMHQVAERGDSHTSCRPRTVARQQGGSRLMATTYDVRVWSIRARKGKDGKPTSYGVRWRVAGGQPLLKSFKTKAAADSFRADLLSAQRKGEAFDTDTGLPVSLARVANEMSWFEFAQRYVDMKWPRAAAKSRVG